MRKSFEYDVIVIGAGHAGCEAALAASRMGCKTLLLTINLDKIALMPCNPAIGGIGKGQLVREIDALGGEMGRNIDRSFVQIKTLNSSKGPAVRALRAQADKKKYEQYMRGVLEREERLELKQALVLEIVVSGGEVQGVKASNSVVYSSKTVVLTTGTFLKGKVVIGDITFPAGRMGEFPAQELSASLAKAGLELGRFQSATPPRVFRRSLGFSRMKIQPGDENSLAFSFWGEPRDRRQKPCYLTYTNKKTHQAVRKYLHLSPIKTGILDSHGPRYCPSIDRKIINFPDKESHPVFVEPEGMETEEMYLQGLTTSLPAKVQVEIVRATPCLEEAEISRPGYAVEYDYVLPYQLKASLETKEIEGLYLAGQVIGTTGYEEAAALGIVSGINAALKAREKPPLILDRSQAYIGVLIDDLVTKGVDEPYRMFTSRAEYRLLLRSDNADLRLSHLGYQLGLLSEAQMKRVEEKRKKVAGEIERLKRKKSPIPPHSLRISELLRRPEVKLEELKVFDKRLQNLPKDILEQVETHIKYEGYIKRQLAQVRQNKRMEHKKIPRNFAYQELSGLTTEAKEKLDRVRPYTLGQAARIPGVSPADISLLMIHLKRLVLG